MKYGNLRLAVDAFRRGENVTSVLRAAEERESNTPEIIEVAYDLQAGTYVEHVKKNGDQWRAYVSELSNVLKSYVETNDLVLDAGTGEMTTLAGLLGVGLPGRCLAFDISWSRLKVGRTFLNEQKTGTVQAFVAEMARIPLADAAVDVTWTSHAIEPNGGLEVQLVGELLRVTRRRLVLFEPSYEHNTPEGRARMERLGYIRDLPAAIDQCGGRLEEVRAIRAISNPLNPTYAYVVTPRPRNGGGEFRWQCPATGAPLEQRADCFFAPESGLAYPILDGIPVLRSDAAILATALDTP